MLCGVEEELMIGGDAAGEAPAPEAVVHAVRIVVGGERGLDVKPGRLGQSGLEECVGVAIGGFGSDAAPPVDLISQGCEFIGCAMFLSPVERGVDLRYLCVRGSGDKGGGAVRDAPGFARTMAGPMK